MKECNSIRGVSACDGTTLWYSGTYSAMGLGTGLSSISEMNVSIGTSMTFPHASVMLTFNPISYVIIGIKTGLSIPIMHTPSALISVIRLDPNCQMRT